MKYVTFVVAAAASLAACGSYNIRPLPSQQWEAHVVDKSYVIGEEQTAFVGQPFVRVKDYRASFDPVFVSLSSFSAYLKGETIQYPAGSYAQAMFLADHERTPYHAISPSPPMPGDARLLIDDSGKYRGLAYTEQHSVYRACAHKEFVCITPSNVDFSISHIERVLLDPGFTNFEIIYSGATKETIHLLYREYTPDDLARWALTQNLTYDRADPLIRFRELQIRVIEANNESIRYVVERDGSN